MPPVRNHIITIMRFLKRCMGWVPRAELWVHLILFVWVVLEVGAKITVTF